MEMGSERPPTHLRAVTGWRRVGEEAWRAAGISPPIEPILVQPDPPWEPVPPVTIRLDIGAALHQRPAHSGSASQFRANLFVELFLLVKTYSRRLN